MVGIVIFTLLVCITTATCVLGCKYLDKQFGKDVKQQRTWR